MEKKYKDILIVKCRPKSKDSPNQDIGTTCGYFNGIANGHVDYPEIGRYVDKQKDNSVCIPNGHADRLNDTPLAIINGCVELSNYKNVSLSSGSCDQTGLSSSREKCVNKDKRSLSSHKCSSSERGRLLRNEVLGNQGKQRRTFRSVSQSPSRELTRKISTPTSIKITPGGFHCNGRVPRDDYVPEYVQLLEAANVHNSEGNVTTSVPISQLTSRRHILNPPRSPSKNNSDNNQFKGKPDHPSVAVLIENPKFIQSTEYALNSLKQSRVGPPIDNPFGRLTVGDRNQRRYGRSLSNSSQPSSPSDEESLSNSLLRGIFLLNTIGNKTGCYRPDCKDSDRMATEDVPTVRDLVLMLQNTRPIVGPLPGYETEKVPRYAAGVCMDECYPGIFIGDMGAAKDRQYLKRVGITHVLNTAEGNKFCTVDTDSAYYKEVNISYLGLRLLDIPSANITQFFDRGAEFIEDCLSNGGKVLVHCFMGISRSSTIVAAFLMMKRNMTSLQALSSLRQHRAIYPNDGFLSQLVDLDKKLRAERCKI